MKKNLIKTAGILAVLVFSGIFFCCAGNPEDSVDIELISDENVSEKDGESTRNDTGEEAESVSRENEETEETDAALICVYVCGAVNRPGVYSLPQNSRKYQAVEMAGGMTQEAADGILNLAEFLTDGERIKVLTKEEAEAGYSETESVSVTESSENGTGSLVNINQADASLLMTLPGIGEGKAAAIVEYRKEHGSFSSTEELMQVGGIKQGIFDKIKSKICI